MKHYRTLYWRVCLMLVILLAANAAITAQEQVTTTPDTPLVRLTGDPTYQPPRQTMALTTDVPLVRITGDITFDKRRFEWYLVGDVPLVVYTGDVRPGITIMLAPRREAISPVIIGDPNLESMQVWTAFMESHDASLFAEDAELMDVARSVRLVGRDAIHKYLERYYSGAYLFRDVYEVPQQIFIQDETCVICETTFHGTALRRNGSLVEALQHPLAVEVPMMSVMEIENGQIVNMRLYYDADQLLRPLGLK